VYFTIKKLGNSSDAKKVKKKMIFHQLFALIIKALPVIGSLPSTTAAVFILRQKLKGAREGTEDNIKKLQKELKKLEN